MTTFTALPYNATNADGARNGAVFIRLPGIFCKLPPLILILLLIYAFSLRLDDYRATEKQKSFPSPDNQKIALVDDGKLFLVQPGMEPLLLLKKVDHSIKKRLGKETWHRSDSLQWDSASRYIYIVRDKVPAFGLMIYPSSSPAASLIRIDTKAPCSVKTVARNFQVAFWATPPHYFSIDSEAICFSGLTRQWKCATPEGVFKMKSYAEHDIALEHGRRLTGKQFVYGTRLPPKALWESWLPVEKQDR